jgi:hypothetical protein
LREDLSWPTSFIPAENHEVVYSSIDVTLVDTHVEKLIRQTDFWEHVLPDVSEWILLEEIFVLIEFGYIVVTETHWVNKKLGVIIHSSLKSRDGPINHLEGEISLFHIN